jgi:hypothetical protein
MMRLRGTFMAIRLGRMTFARLLALFVALAVLLAPAGMMSAAAAMPATHDMAASMPMDHCAGQPEPDQNKAPESCCIVACSALPGGRGELAPPPSATLSYQAIALSAHPGLTAEAATPPPRFA